MGRASIGIVCNPPPPVSAEPPTKFSKRGGLSGSQFLEGVVRKEGVTFFIGFCNFYTKDKLKSGIFKDKKSL